MKRLDTPPILESAFPAWAQFTSELQQLGEKMIARLPNRLRSNPQSQQEVGRLLLEAVVPRVIEAISSDVDHPSFLPSINATLNVHQPNADTVYRNADISDQGVYRLRGERGSVRILVIGQFRPLVGEVTIGQTVSTLQALAHNNFDDLHTDPQGRFDVILSAKRPAGYTGDWWELKPGTGYVVVRQVSSNWATERDPRIAIERLDKPVSRSRPSAKELESRLRHLATVIGNTALSHVAHVEDLRSQGYINRLQLMHTPGALQGQFYYEGAYDITPDDAIIIEAKVPKKYLYWSTILTNDIYETTDWINNQSSLNDSQARVDTDGIVRFVVSAKDPGVPNWLDPAGYLTGAIQGRWTNCDSTPIPAVTKVAFKNLRNYMPADTPTVAPEEREATIRERRAHFQLRPLW
jgi:hypothetical protein